MKKIIALSLVVIMSVISASAVFADEMIPAAEEEMAVVEAQLPEGEQVVQEETEAVEVIEEGEEDAASSEPAMVPTIYSGSCGADVTWTLNYDTHLLEISGKGVMEDYATADDVPWASYRTNIGAVAVSDGVTFISSNAFAFCANMSVLSIPESVYAIGSNVIEGSVPGTLKIYYGGSKSKWENDVKKTESDFAGFTVICLGNDIKNGFCKVDGEWRYYINDVFDIMADGFVYGSIESELGWWYCNDGVCQKNLTDIFQTEKEGENGWWYVKNGLLIEDKVVANNKLGWWYCDGGKVDFNYTGIGHNDNGDWYCKNGKVDFNVTDIVYATFDGETAWWNIKNGHVDYSTVVAHNSLGWWYCENGKVDFNYTGIAPNANGWWRIVNGAVDFNCTSVEENEYGWWRLVDGKVDFNFTGIAQNIHGYWYCQGGKVDFNYDGVGQNALGWWKCKSGKVDFSFTGFGKNSNGEWYCENGKVNFDKTDLIDGKPVLSGQVVADDLKFRMALKAQSYASDTKYLILIDCWNNRLGIFEGSQGKWKYRNNGFLLCATGAGGDMSTIKGEFKITYNRGYSFSGPDDGKPDYTCYYYSGFSGPYLIHSILYHYNTWNVKDGTLGVDVSHGCVRLATEEAKWIYDNCPVGTTVITYK